jgi:hypothetical protein
LTPLPFLLFPHSHRQLRIDSKITPGTVKEGLKIRTEGEEAAATDKVNVKL